MTGSVSTNRIERTVGEGGFPLVHLSHAAGYTAVVSEYGAQLLSWRSPSERELLFLSEAANFQAGKAIRGGIPLVFPQFGKGTLPQHGFARTSLWKVVREQVSTSGPVSITLRLVSDDQTLAFWPHAFMAELDIVLTDVLLLTLRIENTGRTPFHFTSALHTYFRVRDVANTSLVGLKDNEFVDFLNERKMSIEQREEIVLSGPIDRAYRDSPQALSLLLKSEGVRFSITKEGFSDTVVWNPWAEGALAIADLLPTEYQQMLCVESGNILSPVTVPPGEFHSSAQIIRVEPL